MIRINLLPIREAEKKRSGRKQLVVFAALILLEVAALYVYQDSQQSKYNRVAAKNAGIQAKITKIQKKTKDVDKLVRQEAALDAQKAVLDRLVEGQSGPINMLNELARMLTPIEEPKLKVSVAARGWNPDWEPKRLWIDSFEERSRGVLISGHARTLDDLAEFLGRLETSRYFVESKLRVSEVVEIASGNKSTKAKLVKFDIQTLVIYGPADVQRLAKGTLGASKKKKKR